LEKIESYIENSDGFYWTPIITKFIEAIKIWRNPVSWARVRNDLQWTLPIYAGDEVLYYLLMSRDMELRSTQRKSRS
jgi:hypothetical protein